MDKNSVKIEVKNKLDVGLTFKVSRFKEVIKKTKPHKHDQYFELIFLSEGAGFHTVESTKHTVSTPEFYFLKPGQLHFWQFTSIPKGFVVLFQASEFDSVQEKDLIELYKALLKETRISLSEESYPNELLTAIYSEFKLGGEYSKVITHGILRALTGKMLQIISCKPIGEDEPLPVYDKFQSLLSTECPKLHKVNQFADLLNVTPQNLNSICKKRCDESASLMINSQLLLEAKRFILHTDYSINEISEALFFSDTSNFVKFFKKSEGVTPLQFRQRYFK